MPRTNKSEEFNKYDRRREKSESLMSVEQSTMSRDDVMQMLGAARYAEWIAGQSASHVMQFLMTVEDQKLYRTTGDKTFIEFLDRSGLKKKSTYYDHRKLLLKEGPEQYDLFEDLGVPARVRNLLESGDVVIDGNDAVIGGTERIALADGGVGVKKLVEQLVKDKIAAEKALSKLKNVEAENKQLRAEAAPGGKHPYQTALLNVVESMLVLISEAGDLDGDEKAARGPDDLSQIYAFVERLCDAYGEPLPWVRGSWLREPVDASAPAFQSDAIDGDNF